MDEEENADEEEDADEDEPAGSDTYGKRPVLMALTLASHIVFSDEEEEEDIDVTEGRERVNGKSLHIIFMDVESYIFLMQGCPTVIPQVCNISSYGL